VTGPQALTNLDTYFQHFGLDKDLDGEKKRCRTGGIAVMCISTCCGSNESLQDAILRSVRAS